MIRAIPLSLPLAALALCGCSMLSRGGVEPDPGEPPATPEAPAIAAADSMPELTPAEAAADASVGAEPSQAPAETESRPPEPQSEPAAVRPATPAPPAEPEPLEAVAPVQVELSAEERVALAAEARKDLELAEQALRSGDAEPTSAEWREKLDTIRNLIDSAKAAYTEDLRAAATLAHKARLLAEELAGT
jgi:hypothetical protein